jgi:ABC-type branched-subunit amino acid transport system substrate-binding protein
LTCGRIAAVVVAVALTVAASGTAAPGTALAAWSTGAPRAAPGPVRGVTDTTITVGGLGHVSRYGGANLGARARFERANREGGVNGRTIVYLGMRDDGGDAQANQRSATTLVRDDRAFALVPVITPDLGAAPDLLAQRVPYFGWAVSSNFCGNDWGFSFTGCTFPPGGSITSDIWGELVRQAFGPDAVGTTAAVVSENSASGQYFVTTVTAGVEAAGLDVVSGTTPLPSPPVADYGALAQQVLTSNQGGPPDAVFVMASYANVAQLRQAVRNAGYLGVFTDTVEYEPDLVASSTGSLVFAPTAAVETAPANPAMAQLVADVNSLVAGASIDQSVVAGYWSADLFLTAVARAGRDLTPERLVRRANARFTYRVKGTVGPVRFPEMHTVPAPCGTLVQSTGTAYQVVVPYRCGEVVDAGS